MRACAIHMMRSILLLHILILVATLHDEDTDSVFTVRLYPPPDRISTKDVHTRVQGFGFGSGAKEFEPG